MHKIIEKAKNEKRSLLETEAKGLLKEYEISVPDFRLIKSEDEISGLAKEISSLIRIPTIGIMLEQSEAFNYKPIVFLVDDDNKFKRWLQE